VSTLATAWGDALRRYAEHERGNGRAEVTTRTRLARLRAFARDCPLPPSHVTHTEVAAWLEGRHEHGWAAATLIAHRSALVSFQRWAYATGLAGEDPAEWPSRPRTPDRERDRAQDGIRAEWAGALARFAVHERTSGKSATTVRQHTERLQRFARDMPCGPWNVSPAEIPGWINASSGRWAPATVTAHRSAIVAFFRWAHAEGHTREDLAALPSRRAAVLLPPPAWVEPLGAYAAFLRGIGRSEETIYTRTGAVRRFARERPDLGPWEVSFTEIIAWMGGKRWAAETRKLHRDALRSFYGWALDAGRIGEDPARRIPPIRGSRPMPRPVHDDAYESALRATTGRARLALRLAAELGLRRGEVVRVHSRDLYGGPGEWSLYVFGKGSKERVLPVPDDLAEALRALPPGYAFPGGDDGHLSAQWMGKLVSDLLPERFTMHKLRHRFATRAYNVDADVFTVQQLLGHASPATTQRYVLVNDHAKRRLVNAAASTGS
jgi:integrase